MRLDQLEEAIEYRNRLLDITKFKRGLDGWEGRVTLTFGSYEASVTMKCVRKEFEAALLVEATMLANSLKLLGCDLEDT